MTTLFFFLAISILQLVTPSVLGVDTTITNVNVPGLAALHQTAVGDLDVPSVFNFSDVGLGSRIFTSMDALPYVWQQRNSTVGAPPGFNGT